jgi:hypothetical protein
MSSRRRRTKKDDSVVLALFTLARHTPWWGNVLVAIGVYLGLTWAAASLNNTEGVMVGFYTLFAQLAHYGSYLISALYVIYGLVQFINNGSAAHKQKASEACQPETARISLRNQAIRADVKSAQERAKDDAVSRVGLEVVLGTPSRLPDRVGHSSRLLRKHGRNLSETLMEQGDAYLPQATLLTDAERRAYTQLRQLYGESVLICPKVRVVDVITPNTAIHPQRSRTFTSLFRQLSQWHLDFVLVDPATFQILCALELDDSSHQRADRKKRDRILNRAFLSAGVRLERLTFRNGKLHATPVTQ